MLGEFGKAVAAGLGGGSTDILGAWGAGKGLQEYRADEMALADKRKAQEKAAREDKYINAILEAAKDPNFDLMLDPIARKFAIENPKRFAEVANGYMLQQKGATKALAKGVKELSAIAREGDFKALMTGIFSLKQSANGAGIKTPYLDKALSVVSSGNEEQIAEAVKMVYAAEDKFTAAGYYATFGKVKETYVDEDGKVWVISETGDAKQVDTGDATFTDSEDALAEAIALSNKARTDATTAMTQYTLEEKKRIQTQERKAKIKQLDDARYVAVNALDKINKAFATGGLESATGMSGFFTSKWRGSKASDFRGILESLRSDIFLAGVDALRGLGTLTNMEGLQIKESIAALDPEVLSDKAMIDGLETVRAKFMRELKQANDALAEYGFEPITAPLSKGGYSKDKKATATKKDTPMSPSIKPMKVNTQEEFDALPSGAIYIDPDDGKKYRKP